MPATPAMPATPTPRRSRLLVVDDEESVVVTLQAILELEGYAVATASSGAEALRALRAGTFDLVLTDLRLEDLDGLAILAELRRTAPDTVAIMLTGYASLESAIKALREGAYDYLVKPCDVEELKATVARGLERRELAAQLQARLRDLEAANEAIRSMNARLQERVDEATAALSQRLLELERANAEIAALHRAAQHHVEQLLELDRLKSQFLSMASHELKTPLTAISGLLQVALRRKQRRLAQGAPSPDQWQQEQTAEVEQMQVINGQVAKLARLVNELLDVSRIESGQLEFDFQPVDLRQLAAEVVEQMQLTTARHQLALAAPRSRAHPSQAGRPGNTPAANGPVVAGDRDHLEQVLVNLIGNAIKYSPEGGPIEVTVRPNGESVVLSVRDRGVGIPPGELEAVFSLFYRARGGPTRHTPGGMGLGLYISKEIVTRHGGRIWAESEPGHGSTFFVSLPRAAAAPAAAPAAAQSQSDGDRGQAHRAT
jgi:signal transduction histidine kinase